MVPGIEAGHVRDKIAGGQGKGQMRAQAQRLNPSVVFVD